MERRATSHAVRDVRSRSPSVGERLSDRARTALRTWGACSRDGVHQGWGYAVGAIDPVVSGKAELPNDLAGRLGDLEHATFHRGATDTSGDEDVAVRQTVGIPPKRSVPVVGVPGVGHLER